MADVKAGALSVRFDTGDWPQVRFSFFVRGSYKDSLVCSDGFRNLQMTLQRVRQFLIKKLHVPNYLLNSIITGINSQLRAIRKIKLRSTKHQLALATTE